GDVSTFVKLTTLDQHALTAMLLDRRTHGAPSIDDSHKGTLQAQPTAHQASQQLIADLLILGGSLMETQNGLGTRVIDAKRHDEMLAAVFHAVHHQHA